MRNHDEGTRKGVRSLGLLTVTALLAAVVVLAAPPGMASAQGKSKNIASTTTSYVETFYPLWFTFTQFQVAPHNRLIGPDKISPLYQGVVAINDDTLYASSPIDVRSGPVILSVPETVAGYSVLLLDPYGNIYPSGVPSKPAGVTTPTTIYELVGPGSSGLVPGAVTVQLPLSFMVLIFRADRFSNGVNQTAEATAFRAGLAIDGVPTQVRPVAEFAFPVKTLADRLLRTAPILFLRQMQQAVASGSTPPLSRQEQKLSDDFNALFGDGSSLNPSQRAAFGAGAGAAQAAIMSNYLDNRDRHNWIHFTNIGEWKKKVLDRASITEFCQYCNNIQTAAYYHAFLDGNGAPLDGASPGGYVLTFAPPGTRGGPPPATRFWSVTAYTPNAIEPIPNRLDKYLVASYTPGLTPNADGSISIHISRIKPAGVPEANWLPVRNRAFNVMLRVYGVVPKSNVAKNTYLPPPVLPR